MKVTVQSHLNSNAETHYTRLKGPKNTTGAHYEQLEHHNCLKLVANTTRAHLLCAQRLPRLVDRELELRQVRRHRPTHRLGPGVDTRSPVRSLRADRQ